MHDGIWQVYFGSYELGRFDERKGQVQALRRNTPKEAAGDVVGQARARLRYAPGIRRRPIGESPSRPYRSRRLNPKSVTHVLASKCYLCA